MHIHKTALIVMGLVAASASAQSPALDPTTPRIALNQEAKDSQTKLELLQQELGQAQQQIMFLELLKQYEGRIQVRRMPYPSDKEMIPGYIFSPQQIEKGKRYPGLVFVHGAFHGHLDWRYFDLIEYAVSKGYIVMFPEYRGSSGYGDAHYVNNYGNSDVADVLASADYLVNSTPDV